MLYNLWQNVEKLKVYEEAEYMNITILGGNKLLGYSCKFEPELQTALSCFHHPAHFHHQAHYANGQKRAALCQRDAAAFKGTVRLHQVLMRAKRNQQRCCTVHFIPAHFALLYSAQVQHSCCLFNFSAALSSFEMTSCLIRYKQDWRSRFSCLLKKCSKP